MFADQLLDFFSIRHLWDQLRPLVKQWTETDDANLVHRAGAEDIAGPKTFTEGPYGTSVELTGTAIDLSKGAVFSKTIAADATFTITNATEAASTFNLILEDGGAYAITWPAAIVWTDDTPPDLTADGIDVLTFVTPDGEAWYGTVAVSGGTAV